MVVRTSGLIPHSKKKGNGPLEIFDQKITQAARFFHTRGQWCPVDLGLHGRCR